MDINDRNGFKWFKMRPSISDYFILVASFGMLMISIGFYDTFSTIFTVIGTIILIILLIIWTILWLVVILERNGKIGISSKEVVQKSFIRTRRINLEKVEKIVYQNPKSFGILCMYKNGKAYTISLYWLNKEKRNQFINELEKTDLWKPEIS
jgi:TM2 domain-containing membrane protein YozV